MVTLRPVDEKRRTAAGVEEAQRRVTNTSKAGILLCPWIRSTVLASIGGRSYIFAEPPRLP